MAATHKRLLAPSRCSDTGNPLGAPWDVLGSWAHAPHRPSPHCAACPRRREMGRSTPGSPLHPPGPGLISRWSILHTPVGVLKAQGGCWRGHIRLASLRAAWAGPRRQPEPRAGLPRRRVRPDIGQHGPSSASWDLVLLACQTVEPMLGGPEDRPAPSLPPGTLLGQQTGAAGLTRQGPSTLGVTVLGVWLRRQCPMLRHPR